MCVDVLIKSLLIAKLMLTGVYLIFGDIKLFHIFKLMLTGVYLIFGDYKSF